MINFGNLTALYFRHPRAPLLVHIPVVSGPLAWTFVAIFWCGAIMVGAHGLAARIVANVFVWSILAYGLFFLATFKDYTMGFALSVLMACESDSSFHTISSPPRVLLPSFLPFSWPSRRFEQNLLTTSFIQKALGVHQFLVKIVALQWIFAFAIMAALFVCSLGVAAPALFRGEKTDASVDEDRERQPLLNNSDQ